MAKPVATLNGVPVYSDKKMSAIINTQIFFSDGSYANVLTSEVVNKGKGYITIGKPPQNAGSEEHKTLEKRFHGTAVEVKNMAATVSIQPHSESEILVCAKCSESSLEDLIINEENGTIIVSEKNDVHESSFSISGGIDGLSIINGNIVSGCNRTVITTGNTSANIEVDIKIPKKTAVNIFGVDGKVTIGNIDAPLRAKIRGQGKINAGSVTKISAKISGTGNIQIASVKGDAFLEVSGSGNIYINSGEINELNANVSGAGTITVNAKAEEADLNTSGVGTIYVSHVVNCPHKNISGIGRINIGNW